MHYLLPAWEHPVTVDGISGPKTKVAVENFQTRRLDSGRGILGPQT